MNIDTLEKAISKQDRIDRLSTSLLAAKKYKGKAFTLTSDTMASTIQMMIVADLATQLETATKELEEL